MAMSLNTLPQIPLTTTTSQISPDGSSILSSDSSKPTFSTTSGSNVAQQMEQNEQNDQNYQNIKANHNIQPFTSYSTAANINNMNQMNQMNSNPFASNISRGETMLNFADCEADPLPIGFRDDHNFSITDMSFSSLYGMNRGQNNVEFDDNTNSNNIVNNNNNSTNNNCAIYNTNNNDYIQLSSHPQQNNNNPFAQNNSANSHPFTMNTAHDATFCSPFNTNSAADFTSSQMMQTQNNAFNPYYNNMTSSDPRIVSFAPGRPRPGSVSQICCVTAPSAVQQSNDCMDMNMSNISTINMNQMNTKMSQITAPQTAINGNILPIESSNNNMNCCNYTEQFASNNNNNTRTINAPRSNNNTMNIASTSFTANASSRNNNCKSRTNGGEYVYNANGDVIGVLEGYSNIITSNNGQCNTMRPLVLPPIDADMSNNDGMPPVINVVNKYNNDCNFTVLDIEGTHINTTKMNDNKYVNHMKSSSCAMKTKVEMKGAVKQVKTITRSTMKRGRHISSAEKPFVCETCGKGYKYLCNYRSHCKIHTDDAFVCNYCNKRFGRKSNYKEHVRIHTGEAPYKCQFCDRTFKQHHGWKDHLRVHTGEKPYLCKVCGKRFTVGHNLNVHMRIHTGERPYTCDICKKSYRQKSAYNSHIKNVHGIKVQRKVKIIHMMDKKENIQ